MKGNPRNIPSLDGLRALSIGMVIFTHGNRGIHKWFPWIPHAFYDSWGIFAGVGTFFVISGFLITHLLLKELNATKTISLKHFYFRRALRIFPPFYVFLAVAFTLTVLGVFHEQLKTFIPAATYTWNYGAVAVGGSDLLAHTWSLSLEEQFYLLWPLALVWLGARKGVKLALCLILLSPVSRVVSYFLMPHYYRQFLITMLHTGIDTIMFGCLLALLWNDERFNKIVHPLTNGRCALAAASIVLLINPFLGARFRGTYKMVFGITVYGVCISIILLYAVRVPSSIFGRFLNTRLLRHLGVISYSLYLWQEMFFQKGSERFFPLNLLAILACAELSYKLVEQPSFRLRDRWEARFKWKRPPPQVLIAKS